MFKELARRRRFIPAIIAAATCFSLVSSACSPTPSKKKEVDLSPVTDVAPYWCQLIPTNAVPRLTAVSQGLRQDQDVDIHNTLTNCQVGNDTELPLQVQLGLDGEARFQEKDEFEHSRSEARLSPDLGHAIFRTAPEAPSYMTASAFHCGKRLVWIRITIRPVIQGRDPKKDLPELLRIAENRYADLAGCKIKP
jgi:hypothetical protein